MANNYEEFVVGRRCYGRTFLPAGTAFTRLIEPGKGGVYTRITGFRYLCGATDHTITLMRPFNLVTFTADAAASQAVVTISADPGDYSGCRTADNVLASGDYCVYECADGRTFVLDTAASAYVAGSVTMTTNLPTGGVKKGGRFWWFGIQSDTNPNDAQLNPKFVVKGNTTVSFGTDQGMPWTSIPDWNPNPGGQPLGNGLDQPLILYSDNATNQGYIEAVGVQYVHRAAVGRA